MNLEVNAEETIRRWKTQLVAYDLQSDNPAGLIEIPEPGEPFGGVYYAADTRILSTPGCPTASGCTCFNTCVGGCTLTCMCSGN